MLLLPIVRKYPRSPVLPSRREEYHLVPPADGSINYLLPFNAIILLVYQSNTNLIHSHSLSFTFLDPYLNCCANGCFYIFTFGLGSVVDFNRIYSSWNGVQRSIVKVLLLIKQTDRQIDKYLPFSSHRFNH